MEVANVVKKAKSDSGVLSRQRSHLNKESVALASRSAIVFLLRIVVVEGFRLLMKHLN